MSNAQAQRIVAWVRAGGRLLMPGPPGGASPGPLAGARLLRVDDMPESEDEAYRRAREALDPKATGARLTAVYNVGPGSHGVQRALAEHGYDSSLGVVAHDLLDVHRAMLISGALTFVLHQDVHYAVTTAARVLRALCEGVRGALAVSNPRVDILTAENLA